MVALGQGLGNGLDYKAAGGTISGWWKCSVFQETIVMCILHFKEPRRKNWIATENWVYIDLSIHHINPKFFKIYN